MVISILRSGPAHFRPGMVQAIFMDRPFIGDEGALFRVAGVCVAVMVALRIRRCSGARQFGPASVLDPVMLVPGVLVPLAIAGIFRIWGDLRFLIPPRRRAWVLQKQAATAVTTGVCPSCGLTANFGRA